MTTVGPHLSSFLGERHWVSRYLLGTLDSEADMAVGVAHNDEGLQQSQCSQQ